MSLAATLEPIFASAINARITPGGVVAIAEDGVALETLAFGTTAAASDGGQPVTSGTVYDLASLTKPLVTASLAMRAVADGAIELSRHAADLDPWLDHPAAREIEFRHLLGHAAGFPAHLKFFERIFSARSRQAPKKMLLAMAGDVELNDRPGVHALYSDVGYIVLGSLLERIRDEPLDDLFRRTITDPLGLSTLGYLFGDTEGQLSIAPTERAPDRAGELLRGIVHDENARAGIGPFGHAGLFGTADDVLAVAVELNRAIRGDESAIYDTGVAREFITMSAAPNTTWKLGWDTPSEAPAISHAGDLWSRDGFGHLGYTGTSLWLDPVRARAVVILTNRVYCSRSPEPIRDFRRAVMDTIATKLNGRSAQSRMA